MNSISVPIEVPVVGEIDKNALSKIQMPNEALEISIFFVTITKIVLLESSVYSTGIMTLKKDGIESEA